ncbi:hypothetical protein Tco_0951459 [Tanacetum coccineum]|uniref:Uncharacterized protein n=1 Tax=Tanacetum coccineum TaxID=301880 RepID=A0ABQ5E0Y5_9ASTR
MGKSGDICGQIRNTMRQPPPEPSHQEEFEGIVTNFILDQEEKVCQLEEYMCVIGSDFMQLSSEDVEKLKEDIRVYTSPVTYPEEVEETIGIPMKVEPLDHTKLEDLGLNTYNHDIFLTSREISSVDEPEPQLLPNFSPLDVNLRDKRGTNPPIKPHSPDSFRMKVVDKSTINTPPSPHMASFHSKDTYCYYHPCIDDPKKHYGFKPAFGWLLEEIHMTWAHLEKKRTRLRLYTKSLEEYAYSVRQELEETFHVTFNEDDEVIRHTSTKVDDINFNENRSFPDEIFAFDPLSTNNITIVPDPITPSTKIICHSFESPNSLVTNDHPITSKHDELEPPEPHYDEDLLDQVNLTTEVITNNEDVHVSIPIPSPPDNNFVTPAPQDKWYMDKHILLVNILSKPNARVTTKSRVRDAEAASAHKCLYVSFLSEI